MRTILTFAATLAVAALVSAQGTTSGPAQNKAPAKTATAAAVRKTPVTPVAYRPGGTTAAKKPAASTATAAARRTVARKPPVRTTWRTRQSTPTADRYREIQEALVARGYLSSTEATGSWGPSSTEALKRFQAEQTLGSTGRIDSLSLIALGLGPKHDAVVPRVVDGNVESGRN